MTDVIGNLLKKYKSDLSDLSLNTYKNNVQKVLQMSGQPLDNINYLVTDTMKIIELLRAKYKSANTLKTKYASIIVIIRCLELDDKDAADKFNYNLSIQLLTNEIVKLSEQIKAELATGQKTKSQEKNWLTEADRIKIDMHLKSLIKHDIKTPADLIDMRNYVMYNLYESLPTRNDFADSKLIFQPPKKSLDLSTDCNYVILNKREKSVRYLLNVYKTAGTYGQKSIELPSYLYPMLLEYKKSKEKFSSTPSLFLNSDATESLSRNRMSVIYSQLGKIVGKKLGTSLNRHQAVSDTMPLEKMKKLAGKMGHSVQEAMDVYAKI
jgi:hypothetical protein